MGEHSKQPDVVLLVGTWGALWGAALGMWALAPLVMTSHHIRPTHMGHWVVLIAGLGSIFALMGAMLALFAGLFLVLLESLSSRRFRDRTWAYALAAPLLVSAAYLVQGIVIHWMNFRTFPFSSYAHSLTVLGVGWVVVALAVAGLYRRITGRASRLRPAAMAWVVAGLVGAGSIALPLRISSPLPPAPEFGSLLPLPGAKAKAPLLFIGLDGATWRALEPVIARGSAPTLRALKAQGIHGSIEALWAPYWSGAAWSSILTGLPRDVTGVHEDLSGMGAGLPAFQVPLASGLALNPMYTVRSLLVSWGLIRFTPPQRGLLNGTPVWELLQDAGVDSAVVRFRFTYPPDGQAAVVISDWVGDDQWTAMGVRRTESDAVTPRDRARELVAPFLRGAPSDVRLVADMVPGPRPRQPPDTRVDLIDELRLALDIDGRTFEAAESIVANNRTQPFLAIYVGGLDTVEHAFWQYSFPEDFRLDPPAREDVERLGPVIGRYVEYFDRRLSRLLSRYEQAPNVLIVSDHGMGPTTVLSESRAWHAKDGMFLLGGPSVSPDAGWIELSYFDVLPTILGLKGFAKPEELPGRSVVPNDHVTHHEDCVECDPLPKRVNASDAK
jgi:hypothetical protein